MMKQFFQQVCRHDVRRVLCHLVYEHSFEKFQSYGSTAPEQVETQLQRWKNKLGL